MSKLAKLLLVIPLIMVVSGCSIILQKRSPQDLEKIDTLSEELERERQARLELLRAQRELEEQLKKELEEEDVRLSMADKGLTITFVAEVLFDSGKAEIRETAYPVLEKVAKVLKNQVPNSNIAIVGHTDNQPIKQSNWKSNWELSTARAISVLHFLEDNKGIRPERLSAIGYGEYRPLASNDTREGRQQNRRVEVTIMPDTLASREAAKTYTPKAGEKSNL